MGKTYGFRLGFSLNPVTETLQGEVNAPLIAVDKTGVVEDDQSVEADIVSSLSMVYPNEEPSLPISWWVTSY